MDTLTTREEAAIKHAFGSILSTRELSCGTSCFVFQILRYDDCSGSPLIARAQALLEMLGRAIEREITTENKMASDVRCAARRYDIICESLWFFLGMDYPGRLCEEAEDLLELREAHNCTHPLRFIRSPEGDMRAVNQRGCSGSFGVER
jgi:hypothetical protein